MSKVEKVSETTAAVAPITIEAPNIICAIYDLAISEIKNGGQILSKKSAMQRNEEARMERVQKQQKSRYDHAGFWSKAKIADGVMKTTGLILTGFVLNTLGNENLLNIWNGASAEGKNTIISGASSVIGQLASAKEGSYQGDIQSIGASEIELARLKQTAVSDDKRRLEDYSSSSNQTWMQAIQKAAESVKPRG